MIGCCTIGRRNPGLKDAAFFWSLNPRCRTACGPPGSGWKARWSHCGSNAKLNQPDRQFSSSFRWRGTAINDEVPAARLAVIGDAAHSTSPAWSSRTWRCSTRRTPAMRWAAGSPMRTGAYVRARPLACAHLQALSLMLTPFYQSDSLVMRSYATGW